MKQLPATRNSLLVRLSQKSDDAWREFLEIYEQAIYRFARRRGLQDADAWDVTQDVLAAVERKLADWDEAAIDGAFRNWLFRVARNIAVDEFRKQSRQILASGDSRISWAIKEHPDGKQDEERFWTEYRTELFCWAAEQIKPTCSDTSWHAFVLTAIEGQSPSRVAKKLKVSVGSVYAAKFRIVSRVKKLIARLDDDGPP